MNHNYFRKFTILLFVLCSFVANNQTTAFGGEVNEDETLVLSEAEDEEEGIVEIAGYGRKKLSTVLIAGTLLCGHHHLPVSGASVGVSCHPGRKTVQPNWAESTTDEYGDFVIDLPSHLHGIPNLENICLVRVVQLPRSSPCSPGFSGKHRRIVLYSTGQGIRTYTTGVIHIKAELEAWFKWDEGIME